MTFLMWEAISNGRYFLNLSETAIAVRRTPPTLRIAEIRVVRSPKVEGCPWRSKGLAAYEPMAVASLMEILTTDYTDSTDKRIREYRRNPPSDYS